MIIQNFNKINKNLEEFNAILGFPLASMKNILESDELCVDNEKQICDVVINYIKLRRNLEDKSKMKIILEDTEPKKEEVVNNEEKKDVPPEENKDVPPEENKQVPQEEVMKEDNAEGTAKPIFSREETDYNNAWKKKIENLKQKFNVKQLTSEEERSLVECIRFSYLSHSDLLSLSIDPIIQNHRDLVK